MKQIRVHGRRDVDAARRPSGLQRAIPTVTTKHSVRVGLSRDGDPLQVLDDVADDDIVEVEVEGGLRLWMRADDLERELGADQQRGGAGGDTLDLGGRVRLRGRSAATRGTGDWILRGLTVLGFDLAGAVTDFVTDRVEGLLAPGPGLYQCLPDRGGELVPVRPLAGREPTLLFVHGTASSFDGCFSALWAEGSSRGRELAARYPDRILAFQQRTLSESPIQNARELLRQLSAVLPPGSPLHVVSHSRGGLVGELLARGNRLGGAPIDEADLRLFKAPERQVDAAALRELGSLLRAQHYGVERHVCVAAPLRGTTLADGRLDKYLSLILNVLDTVPALKESLVFDTFASLLAAVLKKRLSPADLPGLEAQVPGSPLVRLINRPDVRTAANLRVLGGDVEGTGFWGRLKVLATDLYYREDHDLVVNTPAMFGGADRTSPVRYWIDAGGRVNHFNYFANADTARRVISSLSDEAAPELHEVTRPIAAVTAADYRKRAPLPQPMLIVIPGVMGSQLSVDGRPVWLDRVEIAKGRLDRLSLESRGVAADALVGGAYADIVRHLSATHEIVPFPYDWRQPLASTAGVLRSTLEATLAQTAATGQPIRVLAHSSGGLVLRAMLATDQGRETWQRVCRHDAARMVLLGTPTEGTHAVAALLMGRDSLLATLGLLDVRHTPGELLGLLSTYPGLIELLPRDGGLDLLDPASWERLHAVEARQRHDAVPPGGDGPAAATAWPPPAEQVLRQARAFRERLAAVRFDPAHTIYVAGRAEETPCGVAIEDTGDRPRIVLTATAHGDGRVAWATGIPQELRGQTYYADAQHGDLAADEEWFPAIADLLVHGRTSKLARTPPVSRGSTDAFPLRAAGVDAYPDDSALTSAALGGRRGRKRRREAAPVRIRVVHSNLIWARFPVLVGHYTNDVIVGAEALLDRQLDGRLRELHRLDLYPGSYDRAAVVLNDRTGAGAIQHPGAIVAGLGAVGELTPGALSTTLTHALIAYGAEAVARERELRRSGTSARTETEIELGVTPLLVGAGAGGVKLADSLQAILRAVQGANARLAASVVDATGGTVPHPQRLSARIVAVDLLELFEDRAIQIVRELQAFARVAEFRGAFLFEEVLTADAHGERRATFDELPGWWRRIRISRQDDGALKFETLTDRAGAPVELLPTQRLMVQELLTRAIRTTATDLDLSATLFELLVPRDLKEQAPDRRPLVLVVDETSAMLPWELMHDRWNTGSRPLAVDTGMIRQLVVPPRSRAQRATEDAALVIGDPPLEGSTDFAQLPGAADEAESVATALRTHGFETRALIGDEAHWSTVLSTLFGRSYRVLHIAAHGVHEYQSDGRLITGVVLGHGAFLTPAELEQLRVIPDLVFINCCHLGQEGEYGRKVDVAFPRLAANVAQQLIRMGVRAVVAAGWAVDDQAAKAFAQTFYTEMLAGREFGQAVQAARQDVFTRFGAANTWGAYQCYGDPGFSLRPPVGGGNGLAPVAERELEYFVRQLANRVRGGRDTRDALLAQLERAVESSQPAWLQSGSLCAEIARAYA
ncbi:MAG: CHAT domain-containing protein, partial [Vicinamibacterales bacterium]